MTNSSKHKNSSFSNNSYSAPFTRNSSSLVKSYGMCLQDVTLDRSYP